MSRERFVGIDVGWVTKAIDRAGAALAEAVKASPAWRAKDALLPSIPGVGPVAALTLRAGPPGLGATTGGRLAALVGLAPLAADSRTRQGGRHTRGGRAPVRRALYLAAPSAAAHNPALRAFEERLVARGEEPKVALAAAARKLLAIADAVIQPGQPWRAEVAGDVASSTRPGSQSLLPAAGAGPGGGLRRLAGQPAGGGHGRGLGSGEYPAAPGASPAVRSSGRANRGACSTSGAWGGGPAWNVRRAIR